MQGFITGELGYSLKREFLADSISIAEVERFSYEIYSVDTTTISATVIQTQVKDRFSQLYSGDVNVKVFSTQHGFSFPSDSLRAAKFLVEVEIKKSPFSLINHTELASNYYKGLDSSFFSGYGPSLLNFQESFSFQTNTDGNREFGHDVSFGIRTGTSTVSGRKAAAQSIAQSIFSKDKDTTFGISTMVGSVSSIADSGLSRNYFTESYDLIKNTYNFSRKREMMSADGTVSFLNRGHSLSLNPDGTVEVTEKVATKGKINFALTQSGLENYYSGAYSRSADYYSKFFNTNVMLQDVQYGGTTFSATLVNTPLKVIRYCNQRDLSANYEVTYSNNPNLSTSGAMISQMIDFNVDANNKVEATHSFDLTLNRIQNGNSVFMTILNAETGSSPATMSNYYATNLSSIATEFPSLKLYKASSSWPNIQTKAGSRLTYSNDPSLFVTYEGVMFPYLQYTISDSKPVDIVNEYKVVNRPTKKSVLSYAYQTEKGEVSIEFKAMLGKQSNAFYPDGVGALSQFNGLTLSMYLEALYKYGGSLLMSKFNTPTIAFNWFLSDTKFSFDTEGNLNVSINYTYTIKKRRADGV